MNQTTIAWTKLTWNPCSGCDPISPGCAFCYARTLSEAKRGTPAFPNGFDLTMRPHKLNEPKRIKEPSLIFVNSMSDMFWDQIPDSYRDQMVDVIEATPQHQYQVLTKRPAEALRYSKRRKLPDNFWPGVSVELQDYAGRVDLLRQIDAEIRFVSAEPLLGPLTLDLSGIAWLIVGGESGQHASNPATLEKRFLVDRTAGRYTPRTCRIPWVRSLRHQALASGVPFFFKQWGGFRPDSAGNELDGQTWEQFPPQAG